MDYSCFCHSEEGEQCLHLHTECGYDYFDEANPDETYGDDQPYLYPQEILDTHTETVCGSGQAYLMVFELTYDGTDTDLVMQRIKDKQYTWFGFREDEYEWDSWKFVDSEYADDPMNGHQAGQFNHSVWRMANRQVKEHQCPEGSWLWAVTVCPHCYHVLFEQRKDDFEETPYLCSVYVKEMADKHGVKIFPGISKEGALRRIKEGLSFLIEPWRSVTVVPQ